MGVSWSLEHYVISYQDIPQGSGKTGCHNTLDRFWIRPTWSNSLCEIISGWSKLGVEPELHVNCTIYKYQGRIQTFHLGEGGGCMKWECPRSPPPSSTGSASVYNKPPEHHYGRWSPSVIYCCLPPPPNEIYGSAIDYLIKVKLIIYSKCLNNEIIEGRYHSRACSSSQSVI